MILRTYFGTILTIQQQNSRICNVQCRNSSSHKVITSRTVDDIQFFTIPLYMINGREDRVTILLLYRKIVADCIFGSNSAATFYNTTLIEQRFCEGGFT